MRRGLGVGGGGCAGTWVEDEGHACYTTVGQLRVTRRQHLCRHQGELGCFSLILRNVSKTEVILSYLHGRLKMATASLQACHREVEPVSLGRES